MIKQDTVDLYNDFRASLQEQTAGDEIVSDLDDYGASDMDEI